MAMFLCTVKAETIKLRRTLALWVAVLAPLAICLLNLVVYWSRIDDLRRLEIVDPNNMWGNIVTQSFTLWLVLTLVAYISLETALLGNSEHGERTLKALFVQPVPRWWIYLAKLLVGAGLLALSTLTLVLATVLVGAAVEAMLPGTGYAFQSFPWDELVRPALNAFVLALAALALHTWIGMRFRSFIATLSVGMIATVVNFLVILSQKGQEWGWWLPWTLPLNAHPNMSLGHLEDGMWISLGVALALTVAGCIEISRRDIY
jgi:lantibiotic transport system permease protein